MRLNIAFIVEMIYKKLWKLIIDKNLKKSDVRKATGISVSTFSKMNRNEYVALKILIKLYTALDCELIDIVEIVR